jgi:aspartate aminotransferase-like enzyme
VGLLQQGKDALDSVNGYYSSRVAPVAQAVQQRVQQVESPVGAGEAAAAQ